MRSISIRARSKGKAALAPQGSPQPVPHGRRTRGQQDAKQHRHSARIKFTGGLAARKRMPVRGQAGTWPAGARGNDAWRRAGIAALAVLLVLCEPWQAARTCMDSLIDR